jgi:chromate transporter
MAATARARPSQPSVSLAALYWAFLQVSLFGFGSGLAWAHRIAVERRGWLSEVEFADIISLTQFMPGPNMVGIAICVGDKLRGARGAIAAFCGFTILPAAVGFALGVICLERAQQQGFQGVLHGISVAAAGLLIAAGLRLLRAHHRHPLALVFAGLAFAGIVVGQLPLLLVLLGLAPVSITCAAVQGMRAQ